MQKICTWYEIDFGTLVDSIQLVIDRGGEIKHIQRTSKFITFLDATLRASWLVIYEDNAEESS